MSISIVDVGGAEFDFDSVVLGVLGNCDMRQVKCFQRYIYIYIYIYGSLRFVDDQNLMFLTFITHEVFMLFQK